jgi:Flp pilus assembly protein TadD
MGEIVAGRMTVMGLLVGLFIGCASVPHPDGSAERSKSVKGSSTAETFVKGDLRSSYQQGLSYLEQGQLDNAQAVLEPLTLSNPDRIELHNVLGILYRRRGMLEKAIGEYQQAITLTEKSSAASSKKQAKASEQAKASSSQARASELYNNLAIAYREHGEFKKAEEAYRKAIALNPNFALAHYNLGVLYDLYLNQPGEALRYYRDYERLAGKSQTVDVWIADLEQRTPHGAENAVGQP